MAISDKLTYLNDTKTQLKDMINYGLDTGEKITSETTFRNYVKSLFDAFIKTMTYPDVLYNNLPKVTGEGTSLSLNDTVYAPMKIELSPSALEQGTNPSPDNPQEIHTVSGENTITISNSNNTQIQTYPLSLGDLEYCKIGDYEDSFIKTSGKNMLNPIGETLSNKGITFTNNGDGTFTVNGTASEAVNFSLTNLTTFPITLEANKPYTQTLDIISGTFGGSIVPAFKNNGGTVTYNYFSCNASSRIDTKTPTENMIAHTYNLYLGAGVSITNCTFRVQLEQNSQATPYEPYGSGKWYLKKNIGKVVLDGSEAWTVYTHYLQIPFTLGVAFAGSPAPEGKCDKYVCRSRYYIINNTYKKDNSISMNTEYIALYDSRFTSADDYKTWLSTNNVTLYYQLKTPTYTLLSDTLQTQLDNIQKAISYQDQTNVSQTNADLPFVLSLSAIRDYEEI